MTSSAWQTGARIALFGMIVNSIFAVAKILGGVFGHAYILIADGIESGLDIAGSFVIWSGLKVAARPPDASHPYGHGKAEPIAAVIVGIGVLAAAVGLAAGQHVSRLGGDCTARGVLERQRNVDLLPARPQQGGADDHRNADGHQQADHDLGRQRTQRRRTAQVV